MQTEHAAHLLVEFPLGIAAVLDGFLIGERQVIVVVGIGGAHHQTVGPCSELHVESVLNSLVHVMRAAPVAYHHTIEAPVAFQDIVQQYAVVAVVLIVVQVIGTHQRPRATFLHGSLEGRQIDFVEGTVADLHVHLMTVGLIVVQRIVLHAGRDAFRLQALHIGHHHARCQEGVLAHVFEIAAIERCAENVHTGTENHVLVAVEGFFAQALAIEAGHLRIPGGCQTGQRREGHAGVVGLSGLHPLVPKHIGTNAMRSVVGPHIGNAESFHAWRRELRLCMNHGNLLVERHTAERIFHTFLDSLCLVEIEGELGTNRTAAERQDNE